MVKEGAPESVFSPQAVKAVLKAYHECPEFDSKTVLGVHGTSLLGLRHALENESLSGNTSVNEDLELGSFYFFSRPGVSREKSLSRAHQELLIEADEYREFPDPLDDAKLYAEDLAAIHHVLDSLGRSLTDELAGHVRDFIRGVSEEDQDEIIEADEQLTAAIYKEREYRGFLLYLDLSALKDDNLHLNAAEIGPGAFWFGTNTGFPLKHVCGIVPLGSKEKEFLAQLEA